MKDGVFWWVSASVRFGAGVFFGCGVIAVAAVVAAAAAAAAAAGAVAAWTVVVAAGVEYYCFSIEIIVGTPYCPHPLFPRK